MIRIKEPFNSLSHLVGVLLSIAATIALVSQSWGQTRRMIGFTIYGTSLILVYAASSLYHGARVSERSEDWLRRLDHIAIFGLIAGSYTPICLVKLRVGIGWTILEVIWAIAVAGTFLKLFFRHLPSSVSAAIYMGMGWIAIFAIGPMMEKFPFEGLMWLLGGGIVYSIGGIIFALERPDPYPSVFGHHEIFHLFVLGGSALHFVFMQQYVL